MVIQAPRDAFDPSAISPAIKAIVVYDDACGFCQRAIAVVRWLNMANRVYCMGQSEVNERFCKTYHLQRDAIKDFFVLTLKPSHQFNTGFDGYRALAHHLPLLMLIAPLLYVPPVPTIGRVIYQWIAERRYPLGCETNPCAPKSPLK